MPNLCIKPEEYDVSAEIRLFLNSAAIELHRKGQY